MTQARKYTTATATFYTLAFPLILYFKRNFRSGPCTPNLDSLFPILVLLTAVSGFIVSLIARVSGKKAFGGPALINGSVLFVMIMLIHFNLL